MSKLTLYLVSQWVNQTGGSIRSSTLQFSLLNSIYHQAGQMEWLLFLASFSLVRVLALLRLCKNLSSDSAFGLTGFGEQELLLPVLLSVFSTSNRGRRDKPYD